MRARPALKMPPMKDSAITWFHCLDQFGRIAAKLNEPLADDEVTALVAELAIIRGMFEWMETGTESQAA
jgi:hypothetical protein